MCRTPDCGSTDVSLVGNVQCKCTKITNKRMKITDPRRSTSRVVNRGFVSDATYIVTDDLVVTPFCFSTFACMVASATKGVEISVDIGEKEVLALMGAALASQAVFTDVFLAKEETTTDAISAAFDVDDSDYVSV